MIEITEKKPVVIVGIGQMGGVFAEGFLRAGYPVYPVTREITLSDYAEQVPEPVFVLLAVPENSIVETIRQVPQIWQDRLGLLQNELLPYVWENEGVVNPTAMAVWFEKKKGRTVKVFQPTCVFGPNAEIVCSALAALPNKNHLLLELVKKNLYVLTINIAGLVVGGTTGQLWSDHQSLARKVARDVLTVMEYLTGEAFDRDEMMRFLEQILTSVPDHGCRGRVAEDRLARILHIAREAGLATPSLDKISEQNEK